MGCLQPARVMRISGGIRTRGNTAFYPLGFSRPSVRRRRCGSRFPYNRSNAAAGLSHATHETAPRFFFCENTMTHLMNTYNRLPVAFTHGLGARLYDADGREYLDWATRTRGWWPRCRTRSRD
jgi:hypothetical protein